jgi:hypothetical protein
MARTSRAGSKLFHDIGLEDDLPKAHLLRAIDHHLNRGEPRRHLAPSWTPVPARRAHGRRRADGYR